MSRPKQFEHFRYVGDKRNQRDHDLDNATEACEIDELMAAGADWAVPDLTDTGAVIAAIVGVRLPQ